jgi:hypothetical protein
MTHWWVLAAATDTLELQTPMLNTLAQKETAQLMSLDLARVPMGTKC